MKLSYNKVNNILQAKNWFIEGWNMFKKNPLTWVLMVLIFSIIFMVGGNSLVGRYVVALIMPVLAGGIYIAADRSSNGESPSIENLFSALKNPPILKQLLIIGGIGMAVVALNSFIQPSMGQVTETGRSLSLNVGQHMGNTSFSGFLGLLISWAWSFALIFGVPLVALNNVDAIPALKSSLNAALSNFMPLVVFYIFSVILLFIAIIPFGLGLLVLVPVLFLASYNAYKTIYLK